MRRLIWVAVLAVCGCGVGQVSSPEGASESAEALSRTATLKFSTSGVRTTGTLKKGNKVKVSYDVARLPDCRGDSNGQPAWSITGYWQLDGGPVSMFEAGGYSPSHSTATPSFTLPDGGDLAVWFQVTNRWGCSAWDSAGGANFHFPVAGGTPAGTSIVFGGDWSEQVTGTLVGGGQVTLKYDLGRLPHCRQTYNGAATWDITLSYRFDGGAVRTSPATRIVGMDRAPAPVTLDLPPGAQDLEVWFQNNDRAGCSEYDSDYGRNYHFHIQ